MCKLIAHALNKLQRSRQNSVFPFGGVLLRKLFKKFVVNQYQIYVVIGFSLEAFCVSKYDITLLTSQILNVQVFFGTFRSINMISRI